MIYHSTRSIGEKLSPSLCLINGLAGDGGLYVADPPFKQLKQLEIRSLLDLSYIELCRSVIGGFFTDFPEDQLLGCIKSAYEGTFDAACVAPLKKVGDDFVLELFHGPTCAFKDVALQLFPKLLSAALERLFPSKKILILTATSGDTGKAALEGFCGMDNISIMVFYPDGGVSDIQRLQMVTQQGGNVKVCAVNGDFDDCQTEVKKVFTDPEINAHFNGKGILLSSANSINIGRLLPQVVYYFSAYTQLVNSGEIEIGEKINCVVPTGNFGNILAGYIAMRMGLPVNRLVCASNANDVLYDFFETGIYDANRTLKKTISPSMDIVISSNLERLLYYLSDSDTVAALSKEFAAERKMTLTPDMREKLAATFYWGRCGDADTKRTIRDVYERYNYLMDTHTAVGYNVMSRLDRGAKNILLSTASPYKFASDVLDALGQKPAADPISALAQYTGTKAPAQLVGLESKKIYHTDVIEKHMLGEYVKSFEI